MLECEGPSQQPRRAKGCDQGQSLLFIHLVALAQVAIWQDLMPKRRPPKVGPAELLRKAALRYRPADDVAGLCDDARRRKQAGALPLPGRIGDAERYGKVVGKARISRTAADKAAGDFVAGVLADTEEIWAAVLTEQLGEAYRPPVLVLFKTATPSLYGGASKATGPFLLSCGSQGLS